VRDELLADLAERYTAESYNLFRNNCNNFSDELAQLLCGVGIPQHITGLACLAGRSGRNGTIRQSPLPAPRMRLDAARHQHAQAPLRPCAGMPDEVLSTPFGQMIAPMLHDMERQMRGMRSTAIRPTADAGPAAAAAAGQPAGAAGGPGLHAAEVELEAAVAEGMMRDAQQRLRGLTGQAEERAAAGPGQAAAPARADDNGRLELELAVRAEFERIMAVGGMAAHEAQALALESVAAQRSLDMQRRQPAGAQ
jgi:hypothetical protein